MATAVAIVATNMFEGVLAGLLLAVAKTAWETSHVQVHVDEDSDRSGPLRVVVSGNATFLRLPRILDSLEGLPKDRHIELDLLDLRHLDHACSTALANWADRHNKHNKHNKEEGATRVLMPTG
jgi:MFS superfamily sulfate permease-like transporter